MNEIVIVPKSTGEAETLARGKTIIERLRRGDLPQMVDWFDPGLLAKVGVRTVISTTLGSYTDQRLMQAATDNASDTELANRYNYSGEMANADGKLVACERLTVRPDEPVWVDYIADLGDGFEATYAMAYLLAADELKVEGESAPLPAGRLLIMGGDQVYPDATKQEYSDRLRDPYDWAFATDNPKRKLFAIPGNHDWYDGLSAFSALFCSARDRISKGLGTQIGGWRCHQHRSYFAIKLPHNWWIWGPDIQLADNLDDSQRDYFDLMAEQTMPGDYIILCIAEPSWLHKNYNNLHEISMLARKHGAKVCAVIAGDWHHYSRYTCEKLGIQFITAGGGGAFAHATHGLKNKIDLSWATPTHETKTVASKADTDTFNRMERTILGASGGDFTQNATDQPTGTASKDQSVAPEPKPSSDTDAGPAGMGRRVKAVREEDIKSATYTCEAKSIYPPKSTSRLLCLKNLALPFRNRPFTYLVGLVYFLFAWAFAAADPRQSPITQRLAASVSSQIANNNSEIFNLEQEIKRKSQIVDEYKAQLATQPGLKEDIDKWGGEIEQHKKDLAEQLKLRPELEKRQTELGGPALKDKLSEILDSDKGVREKFTALADTSLSFMFNVKALFTAAEQSPMFAFMLIGLWAALVFYVESNWSLVKLVVGTLHALAHLTVLLFASWFAQASGVVAALVSLMTIIPALQGDGLLSKILSAVVSGDSVYPDVARILWTVLVSLFLGGLLGGFVMGLYWTLTSTLLNMHTGDAFGALGIKDYNNFLRIKLEPGRATIYPIALDRVPGRKGWRYQLDKGEQRPTHHPKILPVNPLKPRLIENAPIVIEAHEVRA